jgi:anaerobic sulfite reductase subunit C
MIEVDSKLCDECATCIGVCPVDAIVLDKSIAVDQAKCISCGHCVAVCPMGALTLHEKHASSALGGTPK